MILPFPIRPQYLLNVCDLLHLWQLAKVSSTDDRQYHLVLEGGEYSCKPIDEFNNKIPLIDEVSLLVLNDLGILPNIFGVFTKIAIARSTISRLQNWGQHYISAFVPPARSVTKELKKRITQIYQPSHGSMNVTRMTWAELEEYKHIIESHRDMIMFSDDAPTRCLVYGDGYQTNGMTTLDLIYVLRRKGTLSEIEAARKIATLCSWHVSGISVRLTDILYAVSGEFDGSETKDQVLDKLEANQDFQRFVEYIWHFKKEYRQFLIDIGRFVAAMLTGENGMVVDDNIILGVWHSWYYKVCLKPNTEQSRLEYLARSCWAVALDAVHRLHANREAYSSVSMRVWSIYRTLVEIIHGGGMTQQIYDRSIALLAEHSARTPKDRRDEICSFLESGLHEGTADLDQFRREYVEASIRRDIQQG